MWCVERVRGTDVVCGESERWCVERVRGAYVVCGESERC